jgi:hypothetical protein
LPNIDAIRAAMQHRERRRVSRGEAVELLVRCGFMYMGIDPVTGKHLPAAQVERMHRSLRSAWRKLR